MKTVFRTGCIIFAILIFISCIYVCLINTEEPKPNKDITNTTITTSTSTTKPTTTVTSTTKPKKKKKKSVTTTEATTVFVEYVEETEPEVIIYETEPPETEPYVETTVKKKNAETTVVETEPAPVLAAQYSASDFQFMGVINWGGYQWTYYSERILPGGGLSIPGRHADESGYICDESDYICLASSTLGYGAIIDTPLGKQGKIYDSGCAAGVVDVYVNW